MQPETKNLQNIREVQSVYNQDQANALLASGWELLGVASGQEQTGPNDYTPIFRYCLGKPANGSV
jgi:hypothetical protein